jgi:hypothetical protein
MLREFEKQNERMEMTSDMMGDAMDGAFEVRLCAIGTWVAALSKQLYHPASSTCKLGYCKRNLVLLSVIARIHSKLVQYRL